MNRRSFLKKALGSVLAVFGLSGSTYYYAREIETGLLHVNENIISFPSISPAFNQFKIVQFSDTHLGFQYSLDQLKELAGTINDLQPDIIVFTGDLVDSPHLYDWNPRLIDILGSLRAGHGKYWIYGNHDHGGYGTEIVLDVMKQADFTLLQNSHVLIEKENERFILAGIDDVLLGKPDIEKALQNGNPDLFTILLAHEPDYADKTIKFPVDVQLSGHSHGGQIRFPFLGHVYTPAYAEKYVEGKYTLQNGKLDLYVNKGIGTTRLPYRFLCQPEIHLFTLENSSSL
ncbi:metallophosphoesterase [Virgibacillus sp. YIM 98842]|uniref:metallophosphoesterase n=1 Tax=Virgibacillus sp. YIM 98842 TaxID=2663533 RepID=UPI0013D9A667|nr:metallophosphoesterase [Virgibacillus sp. YIM 98842]